MAKTPTKILLCISGGIAAYKTPELIRLLQEIDCEIKVIVTQHATAFVSLLTLQTLLPNHVYQTVIEPNMHHIQLAKWADYVLIAPATANTIAKLAHGISDDLLSTTYLATTASIFIAPAMNQAMWQHMATQENIAKLKQRGVIFIGPDIGTQACGDVGPGRMMEPADIVIQLFATRFLNNKRVLITAGATQEPIDPVRYISNKSSGKMGYALVKAAFSAGAHVTLVSGKTSLEKPPCHQFISVMTAADMHHEVMHHVAGQDIFISVAAVSDYTVENPKAQKIKHSDGTLTLTLKPTIDIVATVCAKKQKPFIVAFAAETENIIENAKQKRVKKRADLIVVNDVSQKEIGFDGDENMVTMISENDIVHLEKDTKENIARSLLQYIAKIYA
ncbi:MAG TPA: bifunctional phosphopantothenoylcysteine decarboxylase/phosphopantothenate--cysteine ligase CoaBC [Coxiellaceae bacterium]|nr:bifunctional phosphopantothenoylcysteine decarboxylase/phosphopantothenate--cysteine ligase CoaBC [Coxiellaceae bacterium]